MTCSNEDTSVKQKYWIGLQGLSMVSGQISHRTEKTQKSLPASWVEFASDLVVDA